MPDIQRLPRHHMPCDPTIGLTDLSGSSLTFAGVQIRSERQHGMHDGFADRAVAVTAAGQTRMARRTVPAHLYVIRTGIVEWVRLAIVAEGSAAPHV